MTLPKLSDIKIQAIIIGVIVDNAGTLLAMTLLASALVSTGLTENEVMLRMRSLSGLLLGLIIGLGFTTLGGFFAGMVAKKEEVLHGLCVASIGAIIALVFRDSDIPLWFHFLGFIGMFPAGAGGGYLAAEQRKKKTVPS